MDVIITGSFGGIGQALLQELTPYHQVIPYSRDTLDLDDIDQVMRHDLPRCDILVNCAGHDIDGKKPWLQHDPNYWNRILNTNLIAPMILSHRCLVKNPQSKIVMITSTNCNQYWPNDLAYSLSKTSLAEFGRLLRIDHPNTKYLEIRLGLTKTNFNRRRYSIDPDRFSELYHNIHLTAHQVATKIAAVLMDDSIKFLEISP